MLLARTFRSGAVACARHGLPVVKRPCGEAAATAVAAAHGPTTARSVHSLARPCEFLNAPALEVIRRQWSIAPRAAPAAGAGLPFSRRFSSSSSSSDKDGEESDKEGETDVARVEGAENKVTGTDAEGQQGVETVAPVPAPAEEAEEPAVPALLPREVVSELERFIVGQDDAKRAVAIALRTRWRRRQLPEELQAEVMPKNILMIGPTGVGKTEIARRLAKLCEAPFIKVEATKFTEVGFHGRDVDAIIRDLTDIGIQQQKQKIKDRKKNEIEERVEETIVELLAGENAQSQTKESFRQLLREGVLEDREVTVNIPPENVRMDMENMGDFFSKVLSHAKNASKKRKFLIKDARALLIAQEAEKIVDKETTVKEAIASIETDGIVFIDEIDKICTAHDATRHGADASSEGVQRDLLPLIEGSVVSTKHGNVDTSKILFIASGAFYGCKPSDLLPELQGRLPIRVELKPLNVDDMYRILTEPEANLISQQIALMKAEDINLRFTDAGVREIAKIAAEVNETVENIGARRLHTIVEKIMEEFSFNCDEYAGKDVEVDEKLVRDKLQPMLVKTDLSKFVL